ncbi:MAG: hypothetical protein ACO1NX_06455 [Chitinophagaceae bacterium]
MTPHFFDTLTKLQQAELLQHQSNYVNTRQEAEFTVDLYQMGDFYTEVYYHNTEESFVVIRSFYTDASKQMYLPEHKIRYISYYRYSVPSA